ncbi:MAG TPA: hypothetical protein VGA85_00585 [Dehalococcoidales bacterium]
MKEPRKQFNQDFSNELQAELLRLPYLCYKDSKNEVDTGGYENELIPELFRSVRRTKMDNLLFRLQFRFPNITTRLQYNISHNCHHAVVISGNTILTSSYVQNPDDLPRDALFREFYAGNDEAIQCQITFDYKPEENILKVLDYLPLPDERNYAVLIHGVVEKGKNYNPGFVKIIFPNPSLTRIIDEGIDLRIKYASIVNDLLAETKDIKDNITDNISIKLNKEQKGLL